MLYNGFELVATIKPDIKMEVSIIDSHRIFSTRHGDPLGIYGFMVPCPVLKKSVLDE